MWFMPVALAAEPDVVFVGNSYTFMHDLDAVTAAAFADADAPITASRLADPGLRWVDHVDRVEGGDARWATLRDDPHDWVFLQEQSQIPGFPQDNPEWAASAAAAVTLDGWAAAGGAETALLMTWGRRDGDATNAELYPDFPTMQGRLTEGYLAVRDRLSTAERPVWVIPAGLAFAAVYDEEVAAGHDPLAAGSPFVRLYDPDGSHPSLSGTFLVACTIYATVTGRSPVGLPAPSGIPAEERDHLEAVADALVIGGGAGLTYPWTGTDPDPDPDTDPDTDPTTEDRGCDHGAGLGAGAAALAALAARRRQWGSTTRS